MCHFCFSFARGEAGGRSCLDPLALRGPPASPSLSDPAKICTLAGPGVFFCSVLASDCAALQPARERGRSGAEPPPGLLATQYSADPLTPPRDVADRALLSAGKDQLAPEAPALDSTHAPASVPRGWHKVEGVRAFRRSFPTAHHPLQKAFAEMANRGSES